MAKKILIIEDDTFLQGLASRKLGVEGYEVEVASDSKQAFNNLNKQIPDLILLDLLLPDVDGFEILKEIRENVKWKSVPIIVFSNLSEEGDITKAKALGVTEFMVKANFTLDELAEKIKLLLKK
ncbi:hypothetical protein A2995_00390 [Candidatus Nomurabacteria bacterium RIFCSPLOWO2_01_FULL_33_24]|uniref:Response regulatory domain-containing protein n=1 Tax=Candidatus Nomurabacteria bacterium RIFCSPLOWO2_01_FULL_33_24 TaxID=1801765 RepID=A0A1F6X253_9BACT|nr:MAG: hypothetical protein A2995_00390 [Candidatus Nomurabacteria bacterium RIFCSPLOWO2_01_FULL_33_24]